MNVDMHVHVPPPSLLRRAGRVPLNPYEFYGRLFRRRLKAHAGGIDGAAEENVYASLRAWASTSKYVQRFVLLALDAPHDDDGHPRAAPWTTSTEFVAELANTHPAFDFGASVHPYRRDALAALDLALRAGASLVKWIPSSQRIDLDDPRCLPFYERLAAARVPLLVHTGNEHGTASWGDGAYNPMNHPGRLLTPLRRGVKVIAAHCGARLFLHDPCQFSSFCRLAVEYEHLYGDLSAFGVPTRLGAIRRLLRQPRVLAKVMYGSDFPAFTMPRWFVTAIGRRGVGRVIAERNPFDQPVGLLRELGVPTEVFTRAHTILRLRQRASATDDDVCSKKGSTGPASTSNPPANNSAPCP